MYQRGVRSSIAHIFHSQVFGKEFLHTAKNLTTLPYEEVFQIEIFHDSFFIRQYQLFDVKSL
jgi:hypothetical protein